MRGPFNCLITTGKKLSLDLQVCVFSLLDYLPDGRRSDRGELVLDYTGGLAMAALSVDGVNRRENGLHEGLDRPLNYLLLGF